MRSHTTLVAGVLALVVSGLSCHAGDLLNSTTTGKPPVAARQLKFTTQPGSVAAGAPVPTVRVSALDSSGALAPAFSGAITVSLAANPGSGTLTGTLSETAVNGVATFANLAIDKSGTGYTLRAVAAGLSDATSQAFDVTATQPPPPPPATQLQFTVQPPQSTPVGQTIPALSVSALDATGAVVTTFSGAITVAIGSNPSGGTLSGTRTVNAVSGVATFSTLAIDKAGSGYTLQATSSGLTSATSQTFSITAAPPPPATQLRFTVQPSTTQAGQAISPVVQVTALDASGAVVPSFASAITVAIGTNPAGGTLSGTRTVNASGGVASFSGLTIDKAGSGYTLKATSSGLTSATSSTFDITATPPPPPPPATQLRFTVQPSATQAGQPITPAVQVSALDASGTLVPSFTGAITIAIATNPGSGTLSGTKTINATNGVATFPNLSINNAGTGYTLQATSSGLTGATSSAFNVTAAPPPPATQLRFTVQPASTQAGQSIAPPVQVSALDASGTLVTSFAGGITIAIGTNPAAGTLSGTLTVNATNGVATFSNLSINNAGTGYTLQATSSGLTGATSSAFDVTAPPPPPATQLRFTVQPASTQAGQSIAPPVQVSALDASGTLVTSFAGAITIAIGTNPTAGTLSGTLTVNATNGVATFSNLSINNAGTGYTLQATSSGLSSATSSAFDVTAPPPPPATQLSFTVQPQSTQAGLAISPPTQVSALDASGSVVTTFSGAITMAIGTNPAAGTLSGTLTVNATNGVATFSNLSINNPGTGYTLQATSSGLTGATSNAFNVTAPPPPPATQLGFTVQPTNTLPLATITPAVEVTALDAQGNPVSGFTGTITIAIGHDASPLGNAVLSGTLTVTAVNGVARFSNLTIDQIGVGYTLRATATGLTSAESTPFNIGP